MVQRKFLAAVAMMSFIECTGANFPASPTRLIETAEWSIRVPSKGWWVLLRGNKCETTMVGSSSYNVGSRPMNISIYQGCNVFDKKAESSASDIGKGTIWLGGRIGILQAFKNGSSIQYIAKVHYDNCDLALRCEGDSTRIKTVESVCNSIVSSLEFKK